MSRARQIAEKIAEGLFVNGAGERAERLVLTIDGPPWKRDLGGLCFEAVVERIEAALTKDRNDLVVEIVKVLAT